MNEISNVIIFNGSKKEFDKLLPETYTTLTELVYQFDNESKNLKLMLPNNNGEYPKEEMPEKISVENFVIGSSEYAGVNEHVITNFINFLSKFEIDNLHIQNPPKLLEDQIIRLFPDVKRQKQEYKKLELRHLKEINSNYDNVILGQKSVKSELLQSLFPLTIEKRQKPVVLLFYGKSGIGKTETAKYISKVLDEPIFRKQFSMYQNTQFATYLFGGTHHESSFAKDLLDRESNVLLLDEFDKANPVFHSAFYQLFDEGIYEDRNYSLHLSRSIIICTSNYTDLADIKENLGGAIYSRFDKIIKFSDLTANVKNQIGEKEYAKISQEFNYALPTKVQKRLIEAYDRCENVREIQHLIENTFSFSIINDMIQE
ncbi:AAA family ATPase [Streptococcus orisasini]|uniref:AAA family ATPase n=1 Tax=Streptococcus orisasini TaxID=1080071 RepID=UPI000B0411BB|nr:AAA family ATPase [Streptococcus orisasini]